MRKDQLGKLYNRFKPEERFRLTLEALARGDGKEVRRLIDSCPRRAYTMNDAAYGGRFSAGLEITTGICLSLAPALAQLRMIKAFGAIQPYTHTLLQDDTDSAYFDGHRSGSSHAWRLAGMKGEPPGWETDDEKAERNADPAMEKDLEEIETRVQKTTGFVSEQLKTLERELIVEVRTVWKAFTDFCEEELNFAPETLLKAYFEPMLEEIDELRTLESKPDVPGHNQEALNKYREAMSSTWTALTRSVG